MGGIRCKLDTFTFPNGDITIDVGFQPDLVIVWNVINNGSTQKNKTMLNMVEPTNMSSYSYYASKYDSTHIYSQLKEYPLTSTNGIKQITSTGFVFNCVDYNGNTTFTYVAIKY